MSGRGSGSGCLRPRCERVCCSAYSALEVLQIIEGLVLSVGVVWGIRVGATPPGCITVVGGSFVECRFFSGGGRGLSLCSYSSSLP
jgi:hypothetical protein